MGVLRKVTGNAVSRKAAPVKQVQKRFNWTGWAGRAGQGATKDIFAFCKKTRGTRMNTDYQDIKILKATENQIADI